MRRASRVGLTVCGAGVVVATLVTACSGTGPTASQVKGTVVHETFAAPVTEAVATAASGKVTRFEVADNGTFELLLDEGTSYRVQLVAGDTEVPLAFGGDSGMYATSLPVSGGGAVAYLGLVRGYDPGIRRVTITPPTEPAPACTDGIYEGGSSPCIGEPAAVVCFAGDDEDSDSDSEDGDEGDHQCEDGIDPNGNSCDGGPAANLDDGELEQVEGAVALPQYGLETLACDGEGEDDGEEDED